MAGNNSVHAWIEQRQAFADLVKCHEEDTVKYYRRLASHFESSFADLPLDECDASWVFEGLTRMISSGASRDTAHRVRKMLKMHFDDAVEEGLVERNPVTRSSAVRTPESERKPRGALSACDAHALLRKLDELGDGDGRLAGVRLGLATGARVGEILALNWEDIDLDEGCVTISKAVSSSGRTKPAKNQSSNRTVAIDVGTVDHLREWKETQARIMLKRGQEQSPKTAAITSAACKRIQKTNYAHWLERFALDNGFATIETTQTENGPLSHYRGLQFHQLRHPYVKPTTKKFASFLKFFRAAAIAARSCSIRYSWLMLPFQISPFLKSPA